MNLQLANNLDLIRNKYKEVINHTDNMEICARWKYGKHPTDKMIQGYIDREEMYMYMDGENIAGMVALTMYQDKEYENIHWQMHLSNEEVMVLHILAVCPEYQHKSIARQIVLETIELARKNNKKAVRLDALSTNIPAQYLYESIGFLCRDKQKQYAENTGWTDFLYYEFLVE